MPTTVYSQQNADKFITGKHVDLVVVECTCGLLFAIPERLNRAALRHKGTNGWQISCPLGHTWHYTKSAESSQERKLREQLERERTYSANVIARLDQAQASLSATKGVVTRMKRRASAGVCPCCNRTFQQLARHMETKHPGFIERGDGHLPNDVEKRRRDHRVVVERLLDFLGDGERRWLEINEHLGIKRQQMGPLLSRLLANGEIERPARGVYRKPRKA